MNAQSRFQTNSILPQSFTAIQTGILQRKCASCGNHTVAGGKCEDCKDKNGILQRKSSNNSEQSEVPPIIHEVLNSSGQPLDKTTRAFFEPRFAHNFSSIPISSASRQLSQSSLTIGEPTDVYEQEADRIADSVMQKDGNEKKSSTNKQQDGKFDLSHVRIHTDARAAESARVVNARAYTVGNNIVFGAGQFAPGSYKGRRLIAHELTHVAQQAESIQPSLQRQPAGPVARVPKLSDYNDNDPLHDPSKLTDAEIQKTDEYIKLTTTVFPPLKAPVTPEEALLACRLMLRQMQEGGMMVVNLMMYAIDFISRARSQLGTLKKTQGEVGSLHWVSFNTSLAVSDPSKLQSEFARWLLAGGTEPDAATGKVNCWEMVMFSAYKGGFISKARMQSIYNEAVKQVKAGTRSLVGDTIEVELRRGKEYVLDLKNPDSSEPLPGDIIIFTTAANHVAISLGTKDALGRHNIISHWPPPDGNYNTKQTTIEELLGKMPPGNVVKFWSPKWGSK